MCLARGPNDPRRCARLFLLVICVPSIVCYTYAPLVDGRSYLTVRLEDLPVREKSIVATNSPNLKPVYSVHWFDLKIWDFLYLRILTGIHGFSRVEKPNY